ncbi:uncharacterized protein LOC114843135 [Betta splendens]|uniref:Uncharacterized protein LOC114843135 n=1 Tax=Betta splendens TaxID=158456 RepID=A0A6P7KUG6_BETSP|nr:uncharacterized protein LOC114843135 [Betta splendens]
MASTPSASALSAVLRCRGNVWTRNTPSKRPATAGYSLGLGVGTQRDAQPERARSSQTSAKAASLRGERVRGRLLVAHTSPRVDGGALRDEDVAGVKKSLYPKLWRLPARAQAARGLTPELRGAGTCSKITHFIQRETRRESCARARHPSGAAAGVLKVSVASPVALEDAAHVLDALRSACVSVAALVSQLMLWKLRGSTNARAAHLLCQEEERRSVALANGHSCADLTSTQRDPSCALKITEDRPD